MQAGVLTVTCYEILPNIWRSCLQVLKAKGGQAATHLTSFLFPSMWCRCRTCGLKLTVISWVAGSLLINGRLRLYWELSPTVSVHVSYKPVEYLEQTHTHTQIKQSELTIKQCYYGRKTIWTFCITLLILPLKGPKLLFHEATGVKMAHILEINISGKKNKQLKGIWLSISLTAEVVNTARDVNCSSISSRQ